MALGNADPARIADRTAGQIPVGELEVLRGRCPGSASVFGVHASGLAVATACWLEVYLVFTHILLQLLAQSSTAFIFSFILQLPFLSLMHRSKKPKYIELYLATFELYLIKPYYHHRVQPIFTRPTSARHLAALVLLRRARETNEHRTSQR